MPTYSVIYILLEYSKLGNSNSLRFSLIFYNAFEYSRRFDSVLNGDGNARRIRLMIDRSYKDVIANDSTTMAIQWLQSISQMTRISIYRFKNPYILVGMYFRTLTISNHSRFFDRIDKIFRHVV